MPRIVFVNRFFHPDGSATSQLLGDLAFHLAETGWDVAVITSRQLYDDPARALPPFETVRGVRIHRVWATRFGRRHLPTRALDYLSFYASATAALARLADAHTVVVAETDPPLVSVPSALVAALAGASLVNWTQDLFPEIAERLHVPGIAPLAPLLRRLRNLSLGHARANVVLGEDMAARLRAEGIAPDRIAVIHNWSLSETETIASADARQALRAEWSLGGKLVVGYSGNFGRVHDLATALDAAAALRAEPGIHFLFVGDGAQRPWLEGRVASLGLTNVTLRPYQPRERLAASLAVPDLHLVTQKPEVEGLVVPSKLYAVLAAARPVLFVGDPRGEVARRIVEAGCGRAFPIGAHAELAATLRELAAQPARVSEMGQRARALWAARYQRQQALAAWRDLLERFRD